jgi:DNA-binding transcriptional MerR regulator
MNSPSELALSEVKDTQKVTLPSIPAKRYFTIGEVGDLCAVKPHVLRYWEQEFNQLKPQKRRGNRRYYQHHEVVLIRRIRDLLYNDGFTIHGAKNRLEELDSQGQIRNELEAVLNILGDLRKLVEQSKSPN